MSMTDEDRSKPPPGYQLVDGFPATVPDFGDHGFVSEENSTAACRAHRDRIAGQALREAINGLIKYRRQVHAECDRSGAPLPKNYRATIWLREFADKLERGEE